MMQVEYILYFYMFICVALLIFHLSYLYIDVHKNKQILQRTQRYQQIINDEITYIKTHDSTNPSIYKKLRHRLIRLEELIAYHNAIMNLWHDRPQEVEQYVKKNMSMLRELAVEYGKKDAMQRAYYAYLIGQFYAQIKISTGVLVDVLLSYLDNSTIYCRENVLKAFYQSENINAIESAFQYLQDHAIFHHEKLLTDGLMSFQGDKKELANRLWSHHEYLDETMTISIINFIRFAHLDFCSEFTLLLQDKSITQEIHLAILRYFKIVIYPEIESFLHTIVEDQEHYGSVMRNVACFTLASYPSAKTKEVLKKALCNNNWYVRQNAAIAFLNMHPSSQELQEILQGDDRYACDMLTYQLQQRGEL